MSALKDHPIASALAEHRIDALTRVRPRAAPFAYAIAFFAADMAAAVLVQGLASGIGLLFAVTATAPAMLDTSIILSALSLYLACRGRYTMRALFWTATGQIIAASLWTAGAYSLAGFLDHQAWDRLPVVLSILLFPLAATVLNLAVKSQLVRQGFWRQAVVLVGSSEATAALAAAFASDPALGYAIAGRVDPQRIAPQSNSAGLWAILERYQAEKILFSLTSDSEWQQHLMAHALRDGVPFGLVPDPRIIPVLDWQTTRFISQDIVMLSFQQGSGRHLAQAIKSLIDVIAAIMLLALFSPVFLLAFLCNLFSDGPLFFAHQRMGRGGRLFPCLKFRTMVVDGDRVLQEAFSRDPGLKAEWDATQKLRQDPRVTQFGQFLRKTSLDELPQLINVIRRQMSLVGPRPIVQSEVHFYGDDIAHYYDIRPGVTGLWQVSGRSTTTYARRVQLDLWYVRNWSIWLDIIILLRTLPAVLARKGAH